MLTVLLLCPLIGMLMILAVPKTSVKAIRAIALIATGAALLVAGQLWAAFDPQATSMQWVRRLSWIPQLNIFYHVGLDGISLPMVALTALLGFLACLASFSMAERHKEYFVLYLLLEVGMFGTFIALDFFLFYVFWEVVLVPMYFLIGIWGGGRREYSAFKFFVYTLAGSLAMLLGILALALRAQTFDLVELAAIGPTLERSFQRWLFIAFFFGFAIKVPIVPFHTWLPDAHVDAPSPISVFLAGFLL